MKPTLAALLALCLCLAGCGEKEKQELTKEDVVGTYERKGALTVRYIFLDNGVAEHYVNGKKQKEEFKWTMVDNSLSERNKSEVHVEHKNGNVTVYIIKSDDNLAWIATIRDGKRTDRTKGTQITHKKIK